MFFIVQVKLTVKRWILFFSIWEFSLLLYFFDNYYISIFFSNLNPQFKILHYIRFFGTNQVTFTGAPNNNQLLVHANLDAKRNIFGFCSNFIDSPNKSLNCALFLTYFLFFNLWICNFGVVVEDSEIWLPTATPTTRYQERITNLRSTRFLVYMKIITS